MKRIWQFVPTILFSISVEKLTPCPAAVNNTRRIDRALEWKYGIYGEPGRRGAGLRDKRASGADLLNIKSNALQQMDTERKKEEEWM